MAGRPRRYFFLGLVGLLAVGLVALIFGLGSRYRQLDEALQIIAYIKFRYVEPVSSGRLFRTYLRTGSLEAMLATLHDPYTRYLDPTEYRELKLQTDGSFGGIGVILNHDGRQLVIMKVFPDSPGLKAGLRRGDIIKAINGRSTAKMSSEKAVTAIRGPAGTKVTLTIFREEGGKGRLLEVTITRANIKLPSVEWEIVKRPPVGKVAVITLAQFAERTAAELEEALEVADQAGVAGIVLDLRYNPGGLLDAAIAVASKFLDDGVVMYMVGRNGVRRPYYAEPHPQRHYPLVVLVNRWSASAAEIVAGALKDRGVATLVGTKTFGKGVVQEVIPLGGGGALSVTVAEYLTAGGRSINKIGIVPDVVVDFSQAMNRALKTGDLEEIQRLDDLQRERAFEVLRARVAALSSSAVAS
ncbi:MAG: S41 family peptidase [Firmicutes bacterium]|nr:S41 family peptidase [Bacillota bacterium]